MTTPMFSVVLPAVVALVMFGLGLGLTVADFARVATSPRAVTVTLACQTLLLPAVCFGLVLATGVPSRIALGMMLLAAAPGGVMSSVFSHLAGGDVALNVAVTAVNTALALITMPLITVFALAWFRPGASASAVPPDKVVGVFLTVLVPVLIGVLVRRRRTELAERLRRPVRFASIVTVFLVTVTAIGQQFDGFLLGLARIGLLVLTFSVLSLALGYAVPRLFRIGHRQAVASGLEIGIHNSVIAITVAVSVLGDPSVAAAPALYGAVMFVPAGAFAWMMSRRRTSDTARGKTGAGFPATG